MSLMNTISKAAPGIGLACGIGFSIAAVITAYKATKETLPIVDEMHDELNLIHEVREEKSEEEYSNKDYRKEVTQIYIQNGIKIAKVWIAPVSFLAAAAGSNIIGYRILNGRLARTTAELTIASGSLAAIKGRIREDGQEAYDKYVFGAKEETVTQVEVDDNGKKKKVKQKIKTVGDLSGLAVLFDGYCPNHSNDPKLNFKTLKDKEAYWDEQIRIRENHNVYLIEVYMDLGCRITPEQEEIARGKRWHWKPEYDVINPETGKPYPFVEFIMSEDMVRSFVTGEDDKFFEREYQEHINRLDIPDTQEARNFFRHNYYEPIVPIDFEPNCD